MYQVGAPPQPLVPLSGTLARLVTTRSGAHLTVPVGEQGQTSGSALHGGGQGFDSPAVHPVFPGRSCPASPSRDPRITRRQPADKQTGCGVVRLGTSEATDATDHSTVQLSVVAPGACPGPPAGGPEQPRERGGSHDRIDRTDGSPQSVSSVDSVTDWPVSAPRRCLVWRPRALVTRQRCDSGLSG